MAVVVVGVVASCLKTCLAPAGGSNHPPWHFDGLPDLSNII